MLSGDQGTTVPPLLATPSSHGLGDGRLHRYGQSWSTATSPSPILPNQSLGPLGIETCLLPAEAAICSLQSPEALPSPLWETSASRTPCPSLGGQGQPSLGVFGIALSRPQQSQLAKDDMSLPSQHVLHLTEQQS